MSVTTQVFPHKVENKTKSTDELTKLTITNLIYEFILTV